MRQYAVVPALAACVPMLVVLDGGDAKSICFNAVVRANSPVESAPWLVVVSSISVARRLSQAVLFLLEVDEDVFNYALSTRTRRHVEKLGRTQLQADDVTPRLLTHGGSLVR